MPGYHGGNQALLLYATDTRMPATKAAADAWIAAVPASPVIIGYADIPDVPINDNRTKEMAIGSLLSQFDGEGNRVGDLTAAIRVGNAEFLKKCLLGSGGPQGLAELAFFTGVDDSRGDGYTLVHRGSMCNSLGLTLSEPQGGAPAPITANAKFGLLVPDTPGPALSPTLAQYRATGATLFWHNVMTAEIDGMDLRDEFMSMNFKADYNLERKGNWQDYGETDPLSRCNKYFRVQGNKISGDLMFHSRLPAKYINQAKGASHWGDIEIGCSNAAAIAGGTAKAFVLTLTNVRPNTSQQRAGQSTTQMSHSVSIIADAMTITTA